MAATTKIFQLRPKSLPITTTQPPTSLHFFSSSTTPDPDSNPSSEPTPTPQSESSHSSFFSGIKAILKKPQQQRDPQSQLPGKSFSFASSHPNQSTPTSRIGNAEEIRKNISEFRRRTAAPPPPPSNTFGSTVAPPSLQKLFEQNIASTGEEGPSPDSQKFGSVGSFADIREKIRHLKVSPVNHSDRSERLNDRTSPISKISEILKRKPVDPIAKPSPIVIGGSDSLPPSVFGAELSGNDDDDSSDGRMRTALLKRYDHKELGEKLRLLRPEKKGDKKDWFSLEELSERLVKLREMEERENKSFAGVSFQVLKGSLQKLRDSQKEEVRKNTSKFGDFFMKYEWIL